MRRLDSDLERIRNRSSNTVQEHNDDPPDVQAQHDQQALGDQVQEQQLPAAGDQVAAAAFVEIPPYEEGTAVTPLPEHHDKDYTNIPI